MIAQAAGNSGMVSLVVIVCYMVMLIALGYFASRSFKGTSADYFVASRGIGPFVLLMSLFGTTMTAFAIIGSSGEAYNAGIGVYGKMVSWSGIFHSFCFFLVGIKLWRLGKQHGYMTQIQFFRDRFESNNIGLLLFPILVGLIIPYLLMGVIGGATAIEKITSGAFPEMFAATKGGLPFWAGGLMMCVVVLIYIFYGGVRGAAWANALQTSIFVVLGIVMFVAIANKLGGPAAATEQVAKYNPSYLKVSISEADHERFLAQQAAFEAGESKVQPREPEEIPPLIFLTYMFIPFSVAMFPHLFQHWLTAKSASSFKLSVVMHPLLMMLTWLPCVLIGIWATSATMPDGSLVIPIGTPQNSVLPIMIAKLVKSPVLGGLVTAGVLAAIMSSLDSQFMCLGSIFTNDIVGHYVAHDKLSDKTKVLLGRGFIVVIVAITYLLALQLRGASVFKLGVWCFTGFASLAPLVFGALYWKRISKLGAYATILTAVVVGGYLFWDASRLEGTKDPTIFGVMPVAVIFAASTVAMFVVSLMTPAPSHATLKKFFKNP